LVLSFWVKAHNPLNKRKTTSTTRYFFVILVKAILMIWMKLSRVFDDLDKSGQGPVLMILVKLSFVLFGKAIKVTLMFCPFGQSLKSNTTNLYIEKRILSEVSSRRIIL